MLTAGTPAPEFSLTNQNNETQDLAALRGRDVLMYFYPEGRHTGVHPAGLRAARHR